MNYDERGIVALMTCICGQPLTKKEKAQIKHPEQFKRFLDVDESVSYGYGRVNKLDSMGKIEKIPC